MGISASSASANGEQENIGCALLSRSWCISSIMMGCVVQRIGYLPRWLSLASRVPGFLGGKRGPALQGSEAIGLHSAPWLAASWKTSLDQGFSNEALTPRLEPGVPATKAALRCPDVSIVYDESVHERYPPGDTGKQAFTYFVLTGGRFIYASLIRLGILKLVLSMSASKDVLALSALEVDISNIAPGATVTVKWRGKPVFIRHRTEEDIKLAKSVSLNELRDPEPDADRVIKPEWLVVIGVCTHLGCVPLPNAGDFGGWFCPCHGSHYDISGRARKGPAPYNLAVPSYKFLDEQRLLIG